MYKRKCNEEFATKKSNKIIRIDTSLLMIWIKLLKATLASEVKQPI